MRKTRLLTFASLLIVCGSPPVTAEENWGLCAVPSIELLPEIDLDREPTEIEAATLRRVGEDELYLEGDATLSRSYQSIRADSIFLDQARNELTATGDVIFEDRDIRVQSPSIKLNDDDSSGEFAQPQFELRSRHARGRATSMLQLDESTNLLTDLLYTSCDPGDRDWHLKASELLIDDESGRGSATHTRLFFKEVPFLYLPYFQFPIDDRRMTGLLTPTFGYADDAGLTLIAPVYLNLAPNYDATVTPASYGNRGFQSSIEGRYLLSDNQGIVEYSTLDDELFGEERYFSRWQHQSRLPFNIRAALLLTEASDDEFFNDFSFLAPEYTDDRYLERFVRFDHSANGWNTQLKWQDYQTLDEGIAFASRPYQRSPQLSINGSPGINYEPASLGIAGEWTDFEKEQSITGQRAHLSPTLTLRYDDTWYFLVPQVQLNFTHYRLSNTTTEDQISRQVPILSLDSGLIFERFGGDQQEWLQTLEPRLYFLYAPFEDQQNIPDFDTSTRSFSYANLFRNNRFSGVDRIGDAQQVTFGLSTRLFNQLEGREVLNARAAQVFYGTDRRVSLGNSIETADTSDLVAELDYWPTVTTKLSARLLVDEATRETTEKTYKLNYDDLQSVSANLEYYFSENVREQVLLSGALPLNEQWRLQAKTQYSIRFEESVENIIGLSYESCCWGLKILLQDEGVQSLNYAESDATIYFELTLKGLGQFGENIDSVLDQSIPGFRPGF